MVLLDSSKAQEMSFPTLDFPSFYNGEPLKHLQKTKIVKKSCGNRFKLLRVAGEERSRRIKISNGVDRRKTGKGERGEEIRRGGFGPSDLDTWTVQI